MRFWTYCERCDMQKKLPEEWREAFDLVSINISDTEFFILILREFNNILLACRNVGCLCRVFNNAMSCAMIITLYKVVEDGQKKSLPYLFQEAIKIDKKQCRNNKLGSKVKTIRKIEQRIKPLRDRIWAHPLDFIKPNQRKGARKDISTFEIESYVNEIKRYFNALIRFLENEGYKVSPYKIKSNGLKELKKEIKAFLAPTRSGIQKGRNLSIKQEHQ